MRLIFLLVLLAVTGWGVILCWNAPVAPLYVPGPPSPPPPPKELSPREEKLKWMSSSDWRVTSRTLWPELTILERQDQIDFIVRNVGKLPTSEIQRIGYLIEDNLPKFARPAPLPGSR